MARDLLIEIGTEELPASFIASALGAMPSIACRLLDVARLAHGPARFLGTPRRLSLLVEGVSDVQRALDEQVQGPPARVALDADGNLTRAGLGFARKQGLRREDLFVVDTPKGPYVAHRRREPGRPALEVLVAVVEGLISRIPFPKSMRWGPGDVAFGRPVHWLVALFGESVVEAEFAGVQAGRSTRGHRFLAPAAFDLQGARGYVERLRAAHVVVDVEERKERMGRELRRAASAVGGELAEDAFLLEECASLVEEPHVVSGSFDPIYLDLPEVVVVSVMRDHQRYFAVRSAADGRLLPRYLNVVNTANSPQTIARGNDRVLRARLADARFFVDEDRKVPFAGRSEALDRVVFQAKLGSIGDKVRRTCALLRHLTADEPTLTLSERAASLCKNDLGSLIVGEFPELQGDMGRFYALGEGEDPRVADAIRDHYLPRVAGDRVPEDEVGAAVAVADRMDTLAGCFGIALAPSGSADPFALRRAALGVVRIALGGPLDVSVRPLIGRAWEGYPPGVLADRARVVDALDGFFRARLRAYYAEKHAGDLVDACLASWDGGSVRDLDRRIEAVASFSRMPEYESLAVAFKRTFNIARTGPEGEVDASLLTESAELALAERFRDVRPRLDEQVAGGRYEEALALVVRELKKPIDRFFEDVYVMVDDEKVRHNRLRLLRSISDMLTAIAHFDQLSTR